jgi:crotonobetainyl-CoA:carnitine CoA-transferase CaiB-like acyl-CoA transferase
MLEGLRVLEAGGGHTIGYAGRLLRLAGAAVVKEEPPGGDPVRSDPRGWALLSEGKSSCSTLRTEDRNPSAALVAPGARPPAGVPTVEVPPERHPVLDWAASGAMALTGDPDGPPACGPGWQAAYLSGAAAAASLLARLLPWWSGHDPLPPAEAPSSLGWRAAAQGLSRGGRTSCGGRTRLLAVDGIEVAAGLPRPDDVLLLEAWSEGPVDTRDPWCTVERGLTRVGAREGVTRAQLLGLPFAVAETPGGSAPAPFSWRAPSSTGRRSEAPLVVDLTSLWAGPLCTALLARAGARVVKVESPSRPDPTRRSAPALWCLLDHGKERASADLATADGVLALRRLLERADVVVESSRPRVLDHLGLGPGTLLAAREELLWVSITGYGRQGPWRDRVALGDDAAAAGGIVTLTGAPGRPVFCADAYADPVTGIHAAVATLAALAGGRGGLLDVPMADVVAHLVADAERRPETAEPSDGGWTAVGTREREPVAPPRLVTPDDWWRLPLAAPA